MPAKKKAEDTSEPTVKTPRKRATKKAIESELVASNDSTATSEVVEAVEIKEVNETISDKSVEVSNIPANTSVETIESANVTNLDSVETITDNNQTNTTDLIDEDSGNDGKKKKKKGGHNDGRIDKQYIDVQKQFYERVIGEKLEVTIQLQKLKITGVITYANPFYILVATKQGEQFIYKGSISFISAQKQFRRPFIKRDRPFFNNRENIDNQSVNDNAQVGEDSSNNQPTFDKPQTQQPYIKGSQPNEQPNEQTSEQPMKRPSEPSPLNRYQNQKPKNQSKDQPQKDTREVKVYKIVCAPPVNKPKK